MSRLTVELFNEWEYHNRPHSCYYESAEYDGVGVCPSDYATLREFLEASDFPVDKQIGLFFGRDLDEPNFRSRNRQTEFPVASATDGVSISDRRKTHTLRSSRAASRYYEPTTDEVLSKRAERAKNEAVENEEQPVEVQVLSLIIDRLQAQGELLVSLGDVIIKTHGMLERIEDALAKPKAEPKVNITLDSSTFDSMDEIQKFVDELDKRIERIKKGKSGEPRR